tara:strand:- start:166 stop:522 length:357 start_codon:yes stop_codon:yes gene_type:complete
MKNYANKSKHVMMLCYEDLILYPHNSIREVLNFLSIPIDDGLLNAAIEASSIKNVKETERKTKKAINSPNTGIKGSFVRSGAIGQFQSYLNDEDIQKINKVLLSKGISPKDFIYTSKR